MTEEWAKNIVPLDKELYERIKELVKDVEVDLNECLPDEEDNQ